MNKKYKQQKDSDAIRNLRIAWIPKALTCLLVIVALRLSYIMIVKAPEYSEKAQEQWNSEMKVDAVRGRILDRNGVELAVSVKAYRVDFDIETINKYLETKLKSLSKDQIESRKKAGIKLPTNEDGIKTDDIAPIISDILGMETSDVKNKLEAKLANGESAKTSIVARKIDKEKADKIKALNIRGVIVSEDTLRNYPNDNFLAHVLGSLSSDNKGLNGIELQYNSYLEGIPGIKIAEMDKNNNDLPYDADEFTSAVQGKDVKLTINEVIQSFAEEVAKESYTTNNAKAVSVMVMSPKNGEILAMVNKPDFNPNKPYEGYEGFEGTNDSDKIQKMWRNRLVNDTFEPGSIFKVVTAITGLETGAADANTDFYCKGSMSVGGIHPNCWVLSGHGAQKFGDIIKNSCNVGFMQLGAKIGKEKLTESIKKFGFGELTGIDLPGEAKGIIKPVDEVSDADLATISFGQTNTLNSVQYMAAFNAVANGGTWIQPHVMKEITHADKNGTNIVDETFKPVTREVASKDKCAELRTYLERVVTEGSGANAFIEGYHIAGKTGTAQKVTNGKYEGKYISSFVGMAPMNDPQITVMITVDEPNNSNGDYYASQVAVPYAKPLFTKIFNYLSSTNSDDNSTEIVKDVTVPEVRGKTVAEAKQIFIDAKLECDIDGNNDKIISMGTYPGYTVKEGSKIKLYTSSNANYNSNDVAMPDVKGYTQDAANKLLSKLGINATFKGSGIISGQSIEQGEIIPKGTSVDLTLSLNYKD